MFPIEQLLSGKVTLNDKALNWFFIVANFSHENMREKRTFSGFSCTVSLHKKHLKFAYKSLSFLLWATINEFFASDDVETTKKLHVLCCWKINYSKK